MFWTVLIIILLCAICGVFWLHRKQEREWQHELARLERGMQEGKYIPNGQDADSPHQFSEDAKAAYGKTIARLRLMAARYTPQQEQLSEQPANTEHEESETGMEDIAGFFESQEAKYEYHQDAYIERSSENPYRGFQTTFLYRIGINSRLTESRLSFSNFTIPRIDSPIGVV